MLVGFGYLVAKIALWNSFNLGIAPMVIGFFFLSAIQLIFIGVVGEYVGADLHLCEEPAASPRTRTTELLRQRPAQRTDELCALVRVSILVQKVEVRLDRFVVH